MTRISYGTRRVVGRVYELLLTHLNSFNDCALNIPRSNDLFNFLCRVLFGGSRSLRTILCDPVSFTPSGGSCTRGERKDARGRSIGFSVCAKDLIWNAQVEGRDMLSHSVLGSIGFPSSMSHSQNYRNSSSVRSPG